MAQTVQEFWMEVRAARAEISERIRQQVLQPRDGTVYIVSIKKRGDHHEIKAGRISACSIALAGQRLVEGSHDVATDAQIEKYLAEEKQKKAEIAKMEIARKQTFEVRP